MKYALLIVGMFLSFNGFAFAMPKVGDDAVYDVSESQNGKNLFNGTVELQLVSFDAPTLQFVERTIKTDANGAKSFRDDFVDGQYLLSTPQVLDAVRHCAHYDGRQETITVPAGTFACCAIPAVTDSENGTTWISNVAFTIVKMEMQMNDGHHSVKVLRSQHMAQ